MNASKKPKPGTRLVFGAGPGQPFEAFFATVRGPVVDEPGAYVVHFDGDPVAFARAHGHIPLPPYLGRDDDKSDLDRYQTVYADAHKPGSSAAPTAGLHFDQAVLDDVKARGVSIAHVTLHVGPGTFLPMRGARLAEHVMHAEPWWLSDDTARILNETRARGGRVIAVGTTSVRVLESAAAQLPEGAPFVASSGLTRIFIQPGFQFRVVDGLITNFHLPESTLLVLVSALVGRTRILDAYNEAIAHGYRFYSYGDASLLWRATGH